MIQFIKVKKRLLIFISLVLVFGFYFFTNEARAAFLYFEPEQGEYYQEDVFIVEVKLDTEEERINALKVELTFPQDKLEVVDVSRGDSVLSLWPEEPTYSNLEGKVSFIGGIPLGFEGQGKIVSIPFRVISSEESETLAEITFQDSSRALLNDLLGSETSLTLKKAIFTLFPETAEDSRDEWTQELVKDNIPPESFEIMLRKDPLIFDGKYFIAFFTTDLGTGIDYYEVKEGDGPWKRAVSPYLLEDQSLQGLIKVKAVDKAGNERIAELMPPIPVEPFYKNILFWSILIIIIILIIITYIFKLKSLRKKYPGSI